jgi:asparagine synthase (glutamine-hydrolysing)
VKVVLSGDGADELFGGNQIYREPKSLLPLSWMPKPMMGMMNSMVSLLPSGMKGRNYLMRGTTPLEERFIGNAKIFSEDLKSDVLQHDRRFLYSFPNPADVVASVYERTEHLDAVTRMQYLDMTMWLPGDILAKADKMTMAHGLELRVPYLDRKLFDVVKRIPTEYRIAEGTTKHIFRKAMEGIVPEPIIGRAKLGFPVPLREWLKGERGDELIGLIEQTGMEHYFNLKVIKEMLMKHRRGVADYSRHLWTLYIFSMWHMMNVQAVSYKDIASTSTVNYGRLWEREEQYSRLTEEQHVRL